MAIGEAAALVFLVAKSYSIRGFVRRSVGPLVRRSVSQAFLKNREFYEIQTNTSKYNKNSTKIATFRIYWPGVGLVWPAVLDSQQEHVNLLSTLESYEIFEITFYMSSRARLPLGSGRYVRESKSLRASQIAQEARQRVQKASQWVRETFLRVSGDSQRVRNASKRI